MFSTNAKLHNNNNYFTSIYYFIFLLLTIGCSNVATAIITTGNPSSCFIFSGNILTIGKTAQGQTSQDIYATGADSAVLIIKPNLSHTIDKIIFSGNVYGALSSSSRFNSTAVIINNTKNMQIKDGIEISSGCIIKGKTAIDIQDQLITRIINHGTIDGIYDNYLMYYAYAIKGIPSIPNMGIINYQDGVVKGNISFGGRIENQGLIYTNNNNQEYVALEVTGTVYNSGFLTTDSQFGRGLSLFHNELTNSGTIYAKGADLREYALEVKGAVYNSGSITVGVTASGYAGGGATLFHQELTNTGTIYAKGKNKHYIALEVTGTVYNSGSITVGNLNGAGSTLFHKGLTNTGTIYAIGVRKDGYNQPPLEALEVRGSVYNSGSITIADNFNHEGLTLFHQGLTNSGTIYAKGGDSNDSTKSRALQVDGAVYNSGSITVTGDLNGSGLTLFKNELTNTGTIYAKGNNNYIGLQVDGVAYNSGFITVGGPVSSNLQGRGGALFHKELTNTGTIYVQGINIGNKIALEFTGTVYNSGSITVGVPVGNHAGYGLTLFHQGLTNSGTIYAKGKNDNFVALEVSGAVYNSGSITAGIPASFPNYLVGLGVTLFHKELTNTGTIYAMGVRKDGYNQPVLEALEVSGTVYNSGSITAGNSAGEGSALFHKELTNSGTIYVKGYNKKNRTGLEVSGTVYNSGSITVYTKSSNGSTLFHNELTNSGTIYAKSMDKSNRCLQVYGAAYNSGSITIDGSYGQGSALFHNELTNSGTIYSKSKNYQYSLKVKGTVYNSGSITAGIPDSSSHYPGLGSTLFHQGLTNSGTIYAKGVRNDPSSSIPQEGLKVSGTVYNSGSITVGNSWGKGVTLFYKELTNTGTIYAEGVCQKFINTYYKALEALEVTGTVYNSGFITVGVPVSNKHYPEWGSALFHNELINSGTIYAKGRNERNNIALEVSGTVYNSGSITIGNSTGHGETLFHQGLTNSGTIYAKGYNDNFIALQVDAKAYNSGSITVGNSSEEGLALFHKELTNTGTIYAKGKEFIKSIALEVSGTVYNSGSITVCNSSGEGSVLFHNELTNSGTIYAKGKNNKNIALQVYGTACNSGSITVGVTASNYAGVGATLFHQGLTNTGTIYAMGARRYGFSHLLEALEVTGTVYNSGSVTVGNSSGYGSALFHKELTNSGTIYVKGYNQNNRTGLEVSGTVYNSGSITVYTKSSNGSTLFHNELTNSGTIYAKSMDNSNRCLQVYGAAYNSGSITIGGRYGQGSALFHDKLTNSGTIYAKGKNSKEIALEVNGTAYNSGSITVGVPVGSYAGYGSTLFHQGLTNSGTIYAKGKNSKEIALEVNGTAYNSGSITAGNSRGKGLALFHQGLTNSGTIYAKGKNSKEIALEVNGTAYNSGSITVTVGDLKFNKDATNKGYITATKNIDILQNLTNSGTIEQTSLSKALNLGDLNNQSYTVSNTEYISAGKLIANASITNSGTIMLTSAELKNNTKVSNLSYIQVTNDFTTGPNTSFNNSGTAQLITTSGNIDFKGIADNSAIIIASNNLTTDVKKFTNTGSISIGADASFGAGGVENSATITVGNDLTVSGLFENKTQGIITITKGNAEFDNLHNYTNATITVTAGMLTFNKPATNSGYITANNITTKHVAFTNDQTAQLITTIGGITFGGVVNNSATIISADAIIASTHKFTNSGTVISNKEACKFDDIDNNSGVITIKGSAETSKAVNNTGTITIEKAYTANDVFNNTSPGVVTLGSLTGTQYLVAQFTKKLTNSGTITAINRLEIAKTGQVDNSGVINAQHRLTSEAEFTNTNTVNVTGATNFKGKFINQSQATLTVTGGLAQFTHGYNSGTIHALKGFTTSGFTNSPGSRLKVENADLNISGGSLLNLGSIDIQQSHHLVLHRESRLLNGKHATVNTSKIIISEIAAAFFEAPLVSKMQIENHYILSLQAGSTVKDYIGYASSELSLALPNKSLGNTALLTTTNDASFSIGAKIILDATGQLGYLSSPASLTIYIITANNKLTTGLTTAASLESSLLYSRVYSSEVSHTLHSGSIFIKISEVTITNKSKSLTAKLQLTTPAKLGMKTLGTTKHIGLARSLYQNDILNGAMASTIRPQGSPYPDGYVNNRANKQIIETKGLVALGTFTNPAGFNIMAGGGESSFLGDVTNIGTIKALSGLELTKTAKFINLTTGILTVDTPKTISGSIFEAIFRGELSNQGTINAKSGLETNLFINFQGATLTSGGLWQLLGDATNSGAINADAELELTKTAKFVNLKSGSITIAKQATFSGEASNAGTINADADLTINKFTNSRVATLTIGGNWQLTGETTNAGTIYVKADLGERTATTAMTNSKLTNLAHGSISVSGDAFFNGGFINRHAATITVAGYARFDGASINSGTMHLHNASINARFDNRRGAILYNYGNDSISFHKDAVNDGTISSPRLKTYANTKFTNLQHGIITISSDTAKFIGEASSSGTIHALAALQAASFTNSKAATLTVKELASFSQAVTNDGYIYAYKALTVTKQFINLQHGSITITKLATFNGLASNSGTIHALAALQVASFTNSKAATLTVKGSTNFSQAATNDGYIYGYQALTADKQFTNLQHGSITISNKAIFNGAVSNSGTIHALAALQAASFTNSKAATLTVKGVAEFSNIATNDGYIYAYKDLTVTKQFTNLQHGSITIGDDAIFNGKLYNAGSITITTGHLELNQHATNDGYIHANKHVQLADNITLTNRKRFIAKTITKANHSNTYTQFNNLADSSQAVVATAEVIDDFTEPYLNVDNQSSLFLRGPSTIGNYTGNATSELVLALPANKLNRGDSLLNVQHDATFTQGSKIILTADKAVTYLSTPTSINIVTAGGKLVVDGDRADKLLYSRAYDVNYTVMQSLTLNSILIDITQVTADSSHITADLQITKAQALGMDVAKATLVDSLLNNKIISAEHERVAKPAIILTAEPVKFYNYNNNTMVIGKPASQPAANIYATQTNVAAVAIGTSTLALPKLDKITFVADVIGAVSPTVTAITKDAVIIYGASTSEVSQGIDIQPASHIRGTRGIVIDASLTTNINNQGIIDGANYAIYFAGDGCILNGTIINQGTITSTNYAFYSDSNNQLMLSGARSLAIENKKTGLISGSITVSGTASLVNHGAVNSVDIAIANILNFGSITNSKQQALHIIAEISNTGSIIATSKDSSGIGLEVSGALYNLASLSQSSGQAGFASVFTLGGGSTGGSSKQINSILVTAGLASFTEITNDGIITAKGGFIANNKVYNSGTISIAVGSAKFKQEVTNTQAIIATGKDSQGIGLEVSGTLYNISHIEQVTVQSSSIHSVATSLFSSSGSLKTQLLEMNNILVTAGLASFAEVHNDGIITANGTNTNKEGFIANNKVYNSGTISIAAGSAKFKQEVTNTQAIIATGKDNQGIGLEVSGTLYNIARRSVSSILVTSGLAAFAEVHNDGIITANGINKNQEGFIANNKVYNSGTISIAAGSAKFKQEVTNTQAIIATGKNNQGIGLEVSGTLYNIARRSVSSILVTSGLAAFAEVHNDGIITANGTNTNKEGFIANNKVYNSGTISIAAGSAKFKQEVTNTQAIIATGKDNQGIGLEVSGTLYNIARRSVSSILVTSGLAAFAEVHNDGIITANGTNTNKEGFIANNKVYNSGTISIAAGSAKFKQEVTNTQAIIATGKDNQGIGLEVSGTLYNIARRSVSSILVTSGLASFAEIHNDGIITANGTNTNKKGFIANNKVYNSGTISIAAGSAKFKQEVTNTQAIIATGKDNQGIGLEVSGTLYNIARRSVSSILVTSGLASFAEIHNDGIITANGTNTNKKGFIANNKVYNSGTISIAAGSAKFKQEVTNTQAIIATGKNNQGIGLEVSGTLYNIANLSQPKPNIQAGFASAFAFGGVSTGGSSKQINSILVTSGLASFAEVHNDGIITANGTNTTNEGFIANNKVYNSGTISIAAGSAKFKQEVTNTQAIIATGKDNQGIGLEVSGILYNISHIKQVPVQSLSLFGYVRPTVKSIEMNNILVTAGDLKLNQGVINHGHIESKQATILPAGATITNYNYFQAKTLKIGPVAGKNNAYFNNLPKQIAQQITQQVARAEFTDIVNAPIYINNQSSLLLQGSSTIGNYIGSATSDLVLTLPAGKAKPNYPLLTVVNNATFDAGAKIILAADKQFTYLSTPTTINIIKASTLTIGGTIDELLYSRVYDSSHTIKKQIQTNSMFISITGVTTAKMSGNDYLQAKLELVTIPQQLLSQYQSKFTTSLLGNALLKDKQQRKTQPTIGATKPTTGTTKPTAGTTKLATLSVSKLDVSGIEFYKPIDNHFMLTKDVTTYYNARLIQQQQIKNKVYDYDIYEPKYNIRASIARRNGKDKQHNWREMVLAVGGVSEVYTTIFGFTFVYFANKLFTKNLPKTDTDGYHGIAHISYDFNGISLSVLGIYGVTNYKNKNITGKRSNEFSLAVATSYRFIVDDISINLGLDSKFIGINLSSHSYKDIFNKVTSNEKVFISLGYFIEIATFKRLYHIFKNIGKVSISLHNSYTYVAGIANNDNITVVDVNNNLASIPQDKFNNHRFYTILKTQLDYNNWFYSLSIDYNYRTNQNIYGGNLAVGYRF